MTNNLMSLLRIEYQNRLRFNVLLHEKDRKKKNRAVGMVFVYVLVMGMVVAYSFGLAYGFGYMGIGSVVPGYALTITSMITLFLTFFETNGVLFATRDYDLLMALPITTTVVITAKFLSMYLHSLIFTVGVMLPMAAGYFFWTPFSAGAAVMWLLGILAAPLLPMTIAAIVGTLILAIGSGFRHKILVEMLAFIVLIVGIFGFSFAAQKSAMEDEARFLAMLSDLGNTVSVLMHKIYPLSGWFDAAVNDYQYFQMVLLIAVSFLVYGVFAVICGKNYRRINSALHSHHAASNYKVGVLKRSSVIQALVQKEWKRFTSSSIYMMNTGVGLVFALIAAVAGIFVGVDKLLAFMGIENAEQILPIIQIFLPYGIAMLVNMCNTCSVSLSLEGRNLWVMQSLPISRKQMLQGKMLFNIMLVLPVSLFCNVIFVFVLHVNVVMALLYLLFAAASVALATVWGMFINLQFPNYQWENEVEVIKQGMSSMIGIFSGMVAFLLMAVAAVFLHSVISGEVVLLGFTVICGVIAYVLYTRMTQ